MEHRCSVRKPLEFQLLLYKHGLPIQSGVCRNLGLGGLFIETGDREWRKNEYLEVELLGRNGLPSMRFSVVVVHHNGDGAGLMFDLVSAAQRRRLRAWLFDKLPHEAIPASALAVA
jgi:hypothetical protein